MLDPTASVSALLAFFGLPGGGEWIILLIIGLLLFGRRLPEVGRSIGRSIVEFKRGIRDVEDEVDRESRKPARKLPEEPPTNLPEADNTPDDAVAHKSEHRESVT